MPSGGRTTGDLRSQAATAGLVANRAFLRRAVHHLAIPLAWGVAAGVLAASSLLYVFVPDRPVDDVERPEASLS